jgi:16S rRNA (guanine527-N7)-methyltransferase
VVITWTFREVGAAFDFQGPYVPIADTRRRLQRRLRKAHIDPTPDVVEGLVLYYDLLRRWNEKINLTALMDGDEAVDRLLVEPLVAARGWPEHASQVIDVGSGGGSPAVPLKLAIPSLSLRMIESKTRKAAFLREVVRELSLNDVAVEPARFEDWLSRSGHYERADVVTMRAVRADLKTLANLQQVLRPGGHVFFFTGAGARTKLLIPPQLEVVGEDSLLMPLQTVLLRLRKRST